jgi:mannitol 2-dehydrogenase
MSRHTLSRSNFPALPSDFEPLGYDVRSVQPGIVHIGLGGFHRAHMARYTHDLMGLDKSALAWGITGAGLRSADTALIETLGSQDCLYCLIEREGVDQNRTVIGSIAAAIDASRSTIPLLSVMEDPRIRIVSTTVTENGYHLDRATKTLNLDNPAIAADLAHPRQPHTVVGILVEAYRRRWSSGAPAFTTLCCDNIQHNGNVLEAAVLAFAERVDLQLAGWIRTSASFPNSMVDRITPLPKNEEIAAFAAETGIRDKASLRTEIFRQWVIEDRFVAGRPAWELAGAQFVDDVTPYEFMKLRLLNTSHLAIACLGQLSGYTLISETIEDPLIQRYMVALMDKETGPTLMPVPGIDVADYKKTLIRRFANTAIKDTTQRVNTDAPINYLVEPIRDRLQQDQPIDLLALGLAAWFRRLTGRGENGEDIAIIHPMADLLTAKAQKGGKDPRPLLSISELFGPLGRDQRLIAAVSSWQELIYQAGVKGAISAGAEQGLF